jgi:hypothetical protein
MSHVMIYITIMKYLRGENGMQRYWNNVRTIHEEYELDISSFGESP